MRLVFLQHAGHTDVLRRDALRGAAALPAEPAAVAMARGFAFRQAEQQPAGVAPEGPGVMLWKVKLILGYGARGLWQAAIMVGITVYTTAVLLVWAWRSEREARRSVDLRG